MYNKLAVVLPTAVLLTLAALSNGARVEAADPLDNRLGVDTLVELVTPELVDELAPTEAMMAPSDCIMQDDVTCYALCDFDHCLCTERCNWWFFNGVCLTECHNQRSECYTNC